jgi:hypothetical protein
MNEATAMSDADLDAAYTHFCKTMTEVGEARAELFLARFALLAMVRIADREVIAELVAAAADWPPETDG